MSGVISVFRFEAAKAARSRMTWVILILPALAAAATVWFGATVERVAQAMNDAPAVAPSAYLSLARGASNGFTLGSALLLLYASMLMANEGHWRTFKTIMIRPHRRWEWTVAKFALLLTVMAAMIALVGLAAYGSAAATGKFGDIAEEGYVYFEAPFMRAAAWRAFGLLVPPLVAVCAFGLMISTMTDHPGVAAGGAMGGLIALETVKGSLAPERQVYLFNTYLPSLLDKSYFQALKGFAGGMSDTGWEVAMIHHNELVPLVWAAAMLTVALVVFQRRDFLL